MKATRDKLMFWGALLIMIGLGLRFVSQVDLTPVATKKLAELSQRGEAVAATSFNSESGGVIKTVDIPPWVGWSTISLGVILSLQAIVTPKG